jgi:hypothetical protein
VTIVRVQFFRFIGEALSAYRSRACSAFIHVNEFPDNWSAGDERAAILPVAGADTAAL